MLFAAPHNIGDLTFAHTRDLARLVIVFPDWASSDVDQIMAPEHGFVNLQDIAQQGLTRRDVEASLFVLQSLASQTVSTITNSNAGAFADSSNVCRDLEWIVEMKGSKCHGPSSKKASRRFRVAKLLTSSRGNHATRSGHSIQCVALPQRVSWKALLQTWGMIKTELASQVGARQAVTGSTVVGKDTLGLGRVSVAIVASCLSYEAIASANVLLASVKQRDVDEVGTWHIVGEKLSGEVGVLCLLCTPNVFDDRISSLLQVAETLDIPIQVATTAGFEWPAESRVTRLALGRLPSYIDFAGSETVVEKGVDVLLRRIAVCAKAERRALEVLRAEPNIEQALSQPVCVHANALCYKDEDGVRVFVAPADLGQIADTITAQRLLQEKLIIRARDASVNFLTTTGRISWDKIHWRLKVHGAVQFSNIERRQIGKLRDHQVRYLAAFADTALASQEMIDVMRDSMLAMTAKYAGVYNEVSLRVVQHQASFDDVLRKGDHLGQTNVIELQQPLVDGEEVTSLLEQAAVAQLVPNSALQIRVPGTLSFVLINFCFSN